MNEYIVGLDIGKYLTKLISKKKGKDIKNISRFDIRTKYYDFKNGFLETEGKTYKIVFEDNEYLVGEQGNIKSIETSKTNIIHKISAYTAICNILEEQTDNIVDIVLACPLSVLRTKETKEEYKEYIKGSGPIKINVNNKDYEFEIRDITLKAEGSGIVILEPDKFKDKNIAIIDIGGLNFGFSLYRNGYCTNEDRFSEELGSNQLVLDAKECLTDYFKGNIINLDEAEDALDKGFVSISGTPDAGSIEAIKKAKIDFINKVEQSIKEHGFNLELYDGIAFVGGTIQKLKDQVSMYHNLIIPSDSQWTTCEGLFSIAVAKYEEN